MMFAPAGLDAVKLKRDVIFMNNAGKDLNVRSRVMKTMSKLCFSAIFLLSLAAAHPAMAQASAPTSPCDPEYYKSLKARAWMEAQREISQNQNFIFKPDSVLEYSCFNKFVGVLAKDSKTMFSENGANAPQPGLAALLTKTVGDPLKTYNTKNFPNKSLNGRAKADKDDSTTIAPGEYNCDAMAKLWQEAQCMDFMNDPEQDGFFSFAEYAAGDKRKKPSACTGPGAAWNTNIEAAKSKKSDVTTFFDQVDKCDGDSKVINIGILMTNGEQQKFCVPPGCIFKEDKCQVSKP